MIAEIVYFLCGVLSALCAGTLCRKYAQTRTRLLLWSTLCFTGLALNNIILFVDMVVFPQGDLSLLRTVPALLGVAALIYGFVWDTI